MEVSTKGLNTIKQQDYNSKNANASKQIAFFESLELANVEDKKNGVNKSKKNEIY